MEAYLIYKISPYPSLPKRGIWIVFSKGEGNIENVSSRARGRWIVFSNSGKYWGNSPIEGKGNMDILYY